MAKEKDKEIDKDKMLDQVLADIEKQFGKGAIMKLGGQNNIEIDTVSTGSLSLDDAQSQWELLNKQSEEYLDTINSIYGIQSIANKYTESINEQSISAQQKLSKIIHYWLTLQR